MGRWHGKGAEFLELEGEIKQKDFEALVHNCNPTNGKKLTSRDNPDRTVGYDFTFNAPKSVTLLYELTGDGRVLEKHKQAVHSTMQDIEKEMMVRVRVGGKNEDRTTGNMVWGEFTHSTSRPVDGVTDPHLHTHCYVFNTSFDAVEGKWKAGQFREAKRDAPYFEASYHARLARSLHELGYDIEKQAAGKSLGWEVKGIGREVIDKFSRRTEEIERVAKEKGIVNDALKDGLGARTRTGKNKSISRDDLRAEWASRLTREEKQEFSALRAGAVGQKGVERQAVGQATREALDFALAHKLERRSVVSEKRLLEAALREGVGKVTPEAMKQELANRGEVLKGKRDGRQFVTSSKVLQEEREMLDFVRDGKGVCKPLGKMDRKIERDFLNEQQRNAIHHVWNSPDRVTAIRGGAGVGKTTLMQECVAGIEANGKNVFTFAPSSEASRGVLRQEGFENAETVQRLLVDEKMQEHVKDGVLWVDEAGLLSSKDMRKLMQVAEKQNSRVVLSGDSRQHHSVERGDAFRMLQSEAGLNIAEVKEIQRQQGNYKQAVEHFSTGNTEKGFELLENMGSIHEINDRGQRSNMLLKGYERAVRAREKVLVISPTHKEGKALLDDLRASQRQRGILQGQDRVYTTQRNLNLTEAQKSQGAHYQKGRVVQFSKHSKGFKAGEKLTVSGVNEQGQVLVEKSGEDKALNLQERHKFELFETETLSVARGEQLRITRNGFSLPNEKGKRHRFNNGTVHEVTGFTRNGDVKLANGWVMPKDYGNFTQGYISTSHAAQGKTVDRVLIMQSADSLRAASREQFYVSVSRGKKGVEIFTDDKEQLKQAVTGSGERLSATELLSTPQNSATERSLFNTRLKETAKAYASYFRGIKNRFLDKVSETKESWQERLRDRDDLVPER